MKDKFVHSKIILQGISIYLLQCLDIDQLDNFSHKQYHSSDYHLHKSYIFIKELRSSQLGKLLHTFPHMLMGILGNLNILILQKRYINSWGIGLFFD